jgi:hypothetical protein
VGRDERDLDPVAESERLQVVRLRVPNRREPGTVQDLVERKARVLEESDVRVVAELEGARIENYSSSIHVLEANWKLELEGSSGGAFQAIALEAEHRRLEKLLAEQGGGRTDGSGAPSVIGFA